MSNHALSTLRLERDKAAAATYRRASEGVSFAGYGEMLLENFDRETEGDALAWHLLGGGKPVLLGHGDGTFADVTPGSGFAPVGYLVGGLAMADYNRAIEVAVTADGITAKTGYAAGAAPVVNTTAS